MNASQIRVVVSGSANPSVVSDEPLISKARWTVSDPVPQKMKLKATTISSIHTSGRLTSATGAYSARSLIARGRGPRAMDEQAVDEREHALGQPRHALLGQDDRLERRPQDRQHERGAEDEGQDVQGDHDLRRADRGGQR